MRAIGIAIPFFRRRSGVPIDAQAQAHFNRVIADGGVVPSGLSGVNAFFIAVKAIYGTTDINTAISAAYDAHYLGYKLGAGSGTTLGQAAQKMYAPKGIFGGIGTGSAYWEGVGVAGNFVTTPNAAANQITGDLEIITRFTTPPDMTSNVVYAIAGKWNLGGQIGTNSYLVITNDNGAINNISFAEDNGTATRNITAPITWAANTEYLFKFVSDVNNGAGGNTRFIYRSTDNGVTWTLLNSNTQSGIYTRNNTNRIVEIGSLAGGVVNYKGRISRVTISNTIDGTPVVDFNANQYTGANTWTSTTSEVWTVNSTGAGLADVTQTTAASQPLLLAHTGENYWFGSGVSGNFVSTPNAAANQITGDIEIIAQVKITNQSTTQTIIGKNVDGSNFSYWFGLSSSNQLRFIFSQNGTSTITATSTIVQPFTTSQIGFVKVTKVSSTGVVKFFTSTDGITYTQLGADVASTAGSMFNGNASVKVGAYDTTNLFPFFGSIYRATISNTIDGTPVVDFNPASYNPSVSQTQWSSATGEVWTINTGTATTGYKGVLVDRSIVQSDGVDDRMTSSVITAISNRTNYIAVKTNENSGYVIDDINTLAANGVVLRTLPGIGIITNAATVTEASAVNRTLKLSTTKLSTLTQGSAINNGTEVTGVVVGAQTTDGVMVFANGNGASYSNTNINTLVISNSADNTTNRTAMYNYIKSINNNAF